MNLEKFYNKNIKSIYTYETKLGKELIYDYIIFVFENISLGIEVSPSGEGLNIVNEDYILKEIQRTKISYTKKDIKNTNKYISKIDFNVSDIKEIDLLIFSLDKSNIKISLHEDSLNIEIENPPHPMFRSKKNPY